MLVRSIVRILFERLVDFNADVKFVAPVRKFEVFDAPDITKMVLDVGFICAVEADYVIVKSAVF